MTYLGLNFIFFLPVAGIAIAAVVRRRSDLPTRRAAVVAVVILLLDTAVFDNLMIAAGLFTYHPDLILGMKLFLAPIEDFAYPLTACMLLPAVWALIPSKRSAPQERLRRPFLE